jgi:hypothetical protein
LIYGAGSAGRQLSFVINSSFEYLAVGFIDDDERLHGQLLATSTAPQSGVVVRVIQRKCEESRIDAFKWRLWLSSIEPLLVRERPRLWHAFQWRLWLSSIEPVLARERPRNNNTATRDSTNNTKNTRSKPKPSRPKSKSKSRPKRERKSEPFFNNTNNTHHNTHKEYYTPVDNTWGKACSGKSRDDIELFGLNYSDNVDYSKLTELKSRALRLSHTDKGCPNNTDWMDSLGNKPDSKEDCNKILQKVVSSYRNIKSNCK